jgi:hypothetical protein
MMKKSEATDLLTMDRTGVCHNTMESQAEHGALCLERQQQ